MNKENVMDFRADETKEGTEETSESDLLKEASNL